MDLKMVCELIYQRYPRKVAKRAALKSIMNALTRLHDGESGSMMEWEVAAEWLEKMTAIYANSPAGNRGMFTPHATTFYNQARYLDDPQEWEHLSREELQHALSLREANVGVWRP